MRAASVIKRVLVGLMVFALALAIGLVALPRLTSYSIFVVEGGSMEPSIHLGSLIVVDRSELHPVAGEVGTFKDPQVGLVTHRVVSIEDDLIVTKGDANPRADAIPRPMGTMVGTVRGTIPLAGYVVRVLQLPIVFFVLLTTTGGLLIIGELKTIAIEVSRIRNGRKAAEPPPAESA